MFRKVFLKTKKGIICIVGAIFLIIVSGIFIWNLLYVKVSFNTNGGNILESIYIKKGTQLEKEYTAQKLGHVFDFWTYDNKGQLYSQEDHINKDITLYAQYRERPEVGYMDAKINKVSKDSKIIVHSLVELTDKNIVEHLTVKDIVDNMVSLKVKKLKNDQYEIVAKDGWVEGYGYLVEILTLTQVEFVSINGEIIGTNTKTLSFTIEKENINEYEYKDNVKEVSDSELKSITEKGTVTIEGSQLKTYSIDLKDTESYSIGDVILFGTDNDDPLDDDYYVVTNDTLNNLEVRQATLDDVYQDLELFYDGNVDFNQVDVDYGIVEQQIKDELMKDQKGLVLLTNMYIEGAYNTDAVLKTLEGSSQQEINKMIEASKLASIPADMVKVIISPNKVTDDVVRLKLMIEVNAVRLDLGTKGAITVSFKIEEEFSVNVLLGLSKAENNGWFTYAGVDVVNDFNMSFTIKLQTKEGYTIDLAGDVERFLTDASNSGDSKYDWINEINNQHVMENTFDYIPIIEKEIFSQMIWAGPVSIKIEIDGVASIGAEAALSAQYSVTTYSQAGKTNGYAIGDDTYTYQNGETKTWSRKGTLKSNFNFSLKGAVGIRAGIRVSASLSVLGMNDLYSIGISLEAGVYFEFKGFVNVSLQINNTKVDSSINGGVELEVGVYVELDFIWNCWPFGMDSKDDYTLFNKKFPLYEFTTLGNNLGFDNVSDTSEDNPVKIYSNEYNIFTDGDKIGLMTVITYNKATKKYEPLTSEPSSFSIAYRCMEHWDSKTRSVYCYPKEDINKYVTVKKYGSDKGTISISDDAPDGYKFFYEIGGYLIDPITGEKSDYQRKQVWFQYEKPHGEGLYKITFDVGEGAFPSYDKSQKKLDFYIAHGSELEFKEIPESYTKNGKTYVFDKWSNGFNGKKVFSEGDETIKAIYKEVTAEYTYTFTAMFGQFDNGNEVKSFEIEHGGKLGSVDNPTRTNYEFVGWTTDPLGDSPNVTLKDGYLYDNNNEKIYGNTEIFAVWKEMTGIPTYTLTFDALDGWLVDENGTITHTASYSAKKDEEFWNIPIAIKSPNDALDYYYTDETFGLVSGFLPKASQTYKANYKKVEREFDIFISDSTFIKKNGVITYSDDIIAETTEDKWLVSTFDKKLSLPSASLTIDGKTYTTNKYILIVENTNQLPYSIQSGVSSLNKKYSWNYETLNVTMYGNNTTSILYTSASSIDYGTLISYYYGSSGLDLKGISSVSATAVPYFEIS
ncbi:MAG: hypothetical protein E7168_02330 [Firmicutes bacterium]|nr:hypothetical protein [Bacillota bacterium]